MSGTVDWHGLAGTFREADDVHRDDALAAVLHVCGAGGINDCMGHAYYGLQSAGLGALPLEGAGRAFEAVEVEGASLKGIEDLIELAREAGAELPAKELERVGIPADGSPPLRWLAYVWYTLKDQPRPAYVEHVAGDDGGVRVERFILRRPLIASAKVAERLADAGGDGATATDAAPVRKGKASRDEDNLAVREFLGQNPDAKIRDVAEHIGRSTGYVAKLGAWRAVAEERKKLRKPRPKAVTFTDKLENAVGERDPELQKLMGEQERDARDDGRIRRRKP